jgi:SAM-dependent methyltransferase
MRVLDVGCGAGDVTLLAARIVGPSGRVTGIDRSADSIALATARVSTAGLANVSFVTADAASFAPKEPVDALIGRLVMMYWPDPASVLRHLLESVRDEGIVTFQDYDLEGAKSEPRSPILETTLDRLRLTFARGGAQEHMGLRLGRVFEDAGLPTPQMLLSARVERGPDAGGYHQISEVTRTLLPLMERSGVATAADIDIDTLESRLRQEAVTLRATLVAPPLVAARTRKGR